MLSRCNHCKEDGQLNEKNPILIHIKFWASLGIPLFEGVDKQ